MTAGIAVMNSQGVALATDSTVTVGGSGGKKYTSAQKLFQLSSSAPIALMIYGCATFVGLPWETIIKDYKDHLGTRTFDTITQYAEDIIRFLQGNQKLFSTSAQQNEIEVIVSKCYENIIRELADNAGHKAKLANHNPTEKDIVSLVNETTKQKLIEIKSHEIVKGFQAGFRQRIRTKYGLIFQQAQHDLFKNIPMTAGIKRMLSTIAIELLMRQSFGALTTGIVIVGFGEKEYRPALINLEIEGMVENRPRYFSVGKVIIGENSFIDFIIAISFPLNC